MSWDSHAKAWRLHVPHDTVDSNLAQRVYYAEYALRPALALAEARHDRILLDEVAQFYNAFAPRFTSLGQLRRSHANTDLLVGQGPDSALALPWIEKVGSVARARECQLCAGQFLYPASRLLRLIATIPPSRRTPQMAMFARTYGRLLVHDFVLRYAYTATVDRYGLRASRPGVVALWDMLANHDGGHPSYRYAMLDADLWLLASAAELAGARRADAELGIDRAAGAQLIDIVAAGTRLLKSKRHVHRLDGGSPDSISVSFFDGDFCDHPDMTYSGRADSVLLSPRDSARACGASWDISHAYRIPVLLQALADNRAATGVAYPSNDEIQLVGSQYLDRALYHRDNRPYFRSFFDGTDGWYRVTWSRGRARGYPPPRWCDTRSADHLCLTDGALFGWGLLGKYDARLRVVSSEFMELARSETPEATEFRRRYYRFGSQEFAFTDATGHSQPSLLLFDIVAEAMPTSQTNW